MVQDIVRETYKTLYFSTHTNSNSFTFQNFFSKYENHNVQTFIQKLFSKSNSALSSYFFAHLKAYFCLESVKFHSSDFEIVFSVFKNFKKINLFLDANHLLSCIDLYDDKDDTFEGFFLI